MHACIYRVIFFGARIAVFDIYMQLQISPVKTFWLTTDEGTSPP